jgi:hypothetical protein
MMSGPVFLDFLEPAGRGPVFAGYMGPTANVPYPASGSKYPADSGTKLKINYQTEKPVHRYDFVTWQIC